MRVQNHATKKKKVTGFAKLHNSAVGWVLLFPVVFALFICTWRPIVEGIVHSFYATRGYEVTEFVGLKIYKDVVTDTLFMKTILNTVKYVLWSLVIGFAPPIILAVLLNEVRWIKRIFRVLTYLPALAPSIVISIIWVNMYNPSAYGLLNMLLAKIGLPISEWLQNPQLAIPLIIVSMTWSGTPSSTLIYLAALQGVNKDLYEAALVDGSGIMMRFFKITIPSIASTILIQTTRQIIGVFQVMQQPMVMTGGGPNNASMSVNLTAFNYAFTYMKVSHSLALSAVAFCMLMVLTVVYFKIEKKIKE